MTTGVSAGQIVKEMGWVALLTRGLPLRIVMIGTLTGLQWGIYDSFKIYAGLCVLSLLSLSRRVVLSGGMGVVVVGG